MSYHTERGVRDYLVNRYRRQIEALGLRPDQIPDDFDFLKEAIIDSLGIVELLTDIETQFGHSIDFVELDAEQMTVLGPLAAYIQRKLDEFGIERSSNAITDELSSSLPKLRDGVGNVSSSE